MASLIFVFMSTVFWSKVFQTLSQSIWVGVSTRDNTERLLLMNFDTVESYKTEIQDWDFKTRMYIFHVYFLSLITKVKNEHSYN